MPNRPKLPWHLEPERKRFVVRYFVVRKTESFKISLDLLKYIYGNCSKKQEDEKNMDNHIGSWRFGHGRIYSCSTAYILCQINAKERQK